MRTAGGETARQLVLDIGHTPSYAPEDFLESPSNAEALAMVERWPAWPDRTLLLRGPPGCGKSHLGAIWAARTGAEVVTCGERLDPFGAGAAPVLMLVEDCDRAGYAEAALFHLLNLVRETGGSALLTAREVPDLWGLRTPDLLSRLRLAPIVPIGNPDAALLRAVLVKLFADRQIRIDADVVAYAARHCEQSLQAVSRFVAAVDEESLAAGRRITRPLAAQTLAMLGKETPTLDD